MFTHVLKLLSASALSASLLACGGASDWAEPESAPAPVRLTEAERHAEDVRLIPFEQSYAIEMNRRHAEQVELDRLAAHAESPRAVY
jgi:hypothetical protein